MKRLFFSGPRVDIRMKGCFEKYFDHERIIIEPGVVFWRSFTACVWLWSQDGASVLHSRVLQTVHSKDWSCRGVVFPLQIRWGALVWEMWFTPKTNFWVSINQYSSVRLFEVPPYCLRAWVHSGVTLSLTDPRDSEHPHMRLKQTIK